MKSNIAKEKASKRSSLVYACMEAKRFQFNHMLSMEIGTKYKARMPKPPSEKEAIDQAQQVEMFELSNISGQAALWTRDWKRYWPL